MKVKKKAREQTAMEKRNTAIVTFILVALVPLLLTYFLGFSLGRGDATNSSTLLEKLDVLRTENENLRKGFSELELLFLSADSLYDNFSGTQVSKLKSDLKGLEMESDFRDWDNEKEEFIYDYTKYLDRLESSPNLSEIESLRSVLDMGKKWLTFYSKIIDSELEARLLERRRNLELGVNSELSERIDDLEQQLLLKESEILRVEQGLTFCQELAGQSLGDVQNQLLSAQDDLSDAITSAEAVKVNIIGETDKIRQNILNEMEGSGWFSQNKDEIEDLRQDLELNIITIERSVNDLKTD